MTLPLPYPQLSSDPETALAEIQANLDALAMVYPIQPENLAIQDPGGPPTGAAGGDLVGSTYPNPVVAPSKITDSKVAAANKDGSAATPSMRTIGTGATQAAAGNHGHSESDITGLVSDLAGKQPLNSGLTAISLLTTDPYGRGLLTQTSAANAISYLGAISAATVASSYQPLNANLTAIAALTTQTFGRSLLTQANAAAVRTLIDAASDTATIAALALKASLASPTFTGNVGVPTRSTGDATANAASTSFVQTAADLARLGAAFKPAVYAASIAALPAHTRAGDILTASANGFLAPSFGTRKFTWLSGSYGTGNGQFNTPYDNAVDGSGNIWVADYNNQRVQKLNSSGAYQSQFACAIGNPVSIAINGSGNFYTLESTPAFNSLTLVKYDSSGTYLGNVIVGSGANGGVAIDGSGLPWVTASGDNRLYKFTTASTPVLSATYGSAGSGNGQFNGPVSLIIDGSNNVFVCDSANSRVQKFNSSGVYQSQFGSAGSGSGQFLAPSGIAIDSSGNIWVADFFNGRVQQFTSAGAYSSQVGSSGQGNGQFSGPRGIAFSASDDLYVADSFNHRLDKFGVFSLTAGVQGGVLVRHEGGGVHLENGIFDVTNPGSAGTAWVLTRRADAVNGLLKSGHLVTAQTTNGVEGLAYLLSTPDPITVNTTAIQFDKFQPGGPPTAHGTNHAVDGSDPMPFPSMGSWFGTDVIGAPADAAVVANTIYFARVHVLGPGLLTGVMFQVGSNNTGFVRAALFNAQGVKVAETTSTTVALGAILNHQKVPFAAGFPVPNPGVYYAAIIFSSSTPKVIGAPARLASSSAVGSYTVPSTITLPSNNTTGNSPTMNTY